MFCIHLLQSCMLSKTSRDGCYSEHKDFYWKSIATESFIVSNDKDTMITM